MTAFEAMARGWGATRRAPWMVLLLFGCNLLLAAAVAAPMHTAIADHLGHSAVAQDMARSFSAAWLTEFQIAYDPFLKAFSISIVYAGILFLALNTVLSAGAFEVYASGEGAYLHAFGRGIGKFLLRFARVVLVASFFYFVAFWFWQGPAARGLDRLFRDVAAERWHFYLQWLRWALLFASVFVISAIVEYAKADLVIEEHDSALAALGRAAGFVLAHFGRVMSIYLALGALAMLTMLAYAAFARYFPQGNVVTVLIWFVVAQALLWMRWMFRMASWGAAVAYLAPHRKAREVTPPPNVVRLESLSH
jgi:hypothetical protein